MLRNLILLVIAIAFALRGSAVAANDADRVKGGLIPVSVVDDDRIYKAMSFAVPPLGEPRWKAPRPVAAWDGPRKCGDFGPDCPQAAPYPPGSLYYSAPHKQSKDSFYSSFFLPTPAWARMTATGRSKPYLYIFSQVPPNPSSRRQGAYRVGEIVYVFNNLNRQNPPLQEADNKIGRKEIT
jgi:carboxylesterase type B